VFRRAGNLIAASLLVGAGAGCSSDDAGGSDAADIDAPIPSVTVPAARLTPFCVAMIDLAEELETDPPDDAAALILETYLGIVDDVPAAIENEFRAVIAELQRSDPAAPGSTDPITSTSLLVDENFDAEGRLPGDTPSERVNDYVLFTCRGSGNNPGPPATEPLSDVVLDDEG
jgi:hypothetical protein